jgi:hypothetical protein
VILTANFLPAPYLRMSGANPLLSIYDFMLTETALLPGLGLVSVGPENSLP